MTLPFQTTAPLGFMPNEPEAVYRASGCLGSTMIKDYIGSPYGFFQRYVQRDSRWKFAGNAGTAIGSALHLASQGEDHYRARYRIVPPEHCTKSGAISTSAKTVAWLAEQTTEMVSPEQDALVRFLLDRVASNPVAMQLLSGTQREVTGRLIDPQTKLPIQVRFDALHAEWMVDLKTTSDTCDRFKWAARNYRYDIQAALYTSVHAGLSGKRLPFYWVVVSTVYPFECRVFECPEWYIDKAMGDIDGALAGIAAENWGKPQENPDILDAVLA